MPSSQFSGSTTTDATPPFSFATVSSLIFRYRYDVFVTLHRTHIQKARLDLFTFFVWGFCGL